MAHVCEEDHEKPGLLRNIEGNSQVKVVEVCKEDYEKPGLLRNIEGNNEVKMVEGCAEDYEKPTLLHNGEDNQSIKDSSPSSDTNFSIRNLPTRAKYALAMLSTTNFFCGCAFSLLPPFFPEEAARQGLSTTVTGVIFSIFTLVMFISSPIFGNYLTKIGAKLMFVTGIFAGGLCTVLFGTLTNCPPGNVFAAMCMLVRAVEALGWSAFITANFAIITREFPHHVATMYGIQETANGVGLMLGPALGGAMYEVGGYGPPFFLIGSLNLINAAFTIIFLPSPKGQEDIKRKVPVYHLLRSPTILITIASIISGSLALSFLDPTLATHLDKLKLSTTIVGLFFIIQPALNSVMSPVWGHFSDSKNIPGLLLVLGNLGLMIGFLFLGPSPLLPFLTYELWTVILGLVITGVFYGCAIIPTMLCLVKGALELGFEDNIDTVGVVSGLWNSVWNFVHFVGPTLGAALVDEIGFPWVTTINSGCFLIAMVLALVYFPSCVKKSGPRNVQKLKDARFDERDVDVVLREEGVLEILSSS